MHGVVPRMATSPSNSPLVSPARLAALATQPNVRVVDCRFSLNDVNQGRNAYEAAHVPGAVYADLNQDLSGPVTAGSGRHPLPLPEAFAEWLGRNGIGNEHVVVAYDAADGSMAAARCWWLLRYLGHDAVFVLDGGFAAYQREGYATTREASTHAPTQFLARPRPELIVDRSAVAAASTTGTTLLDARAPERFRGEVEPIDKRAGHIPAARSLPIGALADGGRLRPSAELQPLFAQALAGAAPETTVAYCGSGVTACQLLLAAEAAGYSGMRLYPGSWSEWITDPASPIATGS